MVFSYSKEIGWLIDYGDIVIREFKDASRNVITNFMPEWVENVYKHQSKLEGIHSIYFMNKFNKSIDTKRFLETWWIEYRNCIQREDGIDSMTKLHDPYQYLIGLLYRLYGGRD